MAIDRNPFKYPASTKGVVGGTTNAFEASVNNLKSARASGMSNIGSTSENLVVTSTNISIYSNGMKIGFVQNFSPNEQRTITPIQELGTEGVVQMVAGNTNGGSISLSKFALYNANLFNSLGLTDSGKYDNKMENPFKTLKNQRVPLEIVVRTECANKVIEEKYIDCWLTNYSKTIASSTITITESCTISYSDVLYDEIAR